MSFLEELAKHWLSIVLAGTSSGLAILARWLWKRLQKEIAEQKSMREAMLAMLSDRLFQSCKYHIGKGLISFEEFRTLTQLYNSYTALGGNGFGTALYEQVKTLKKTRDEIVTVSADDVNYDDYLIGDGVLIPKK